MPQTQVRCILKAIAVGQVFAANPSAGGLDALPCRAAGCQTVGLDTHCHVVSLARGQSRKHIRRGSLQHRVAVGCQPIPAGPPRPMKPNSRIVNIGYLYVAHTVVTDCAVLSLTQIAKRKPIGWIGGACAEQEGQTSRLGDYIHITNPNTAYTSRRVVPIPNPQSVHNIIVSPQPYVHPLGGRQCKSAVERVAVLVAGSAVVVNHSRWMLATENLCAALRHIHTVLSPCPTSANHANNYGNQ